jgi:hypothetical protein
VAGSDIGKINLFIWGLFKGDANCPDYVASDKMNNELENAWKEAIVA